MSKIEDAKKILAALGLPDAQQNEISALTLLALCNLKEVSNWCDASKKSVRISNDIMAFVNENFKKDQPYAPNTRETFRRQVLHQFVQAKVVDYNPDIPDLPVNSPRAHYAISPEALHVIQSYGSVNWDNEVSKFAETIGLLRERYAKKREQHLIPVTVNGKELKLSPGAHNEVQAAVINEFAPQFASGSEVLYLGDTANKDLHIDKDTLASLGITITEHSKLPDIIVLDRDKGWLFLIEVVTSHGPISPKRIVELEDLLKDCPIGKVYVTAFENRIEFRKYIADIAWETEVWFADTPEHMVHFNGDRFIGPR
ncbi:MAG: BsuBI/PstI family type II restriction endonuclease [bacterium]